MVADNRGAAEAPGDLAPPLETHRSPASRGRAIMRRSNLPTGRAVVGALLVTIAIVGLFVSFRQAETGPDTSYVVAATRVPAGQVYTPTDVTTRYLDLADDVAALAMTDPDDVVGAVALETALPGQLIQGQALLPRSDGEDPDLGVAGDAVFEVSFAIDSARALGGRLRVGEKVDVVSTLSEGSDACTTVVASGARVVRTDGGGSDTFGRSGSLTITLGIADGPAVLGTVHAADRGDATLVRRTRVGDTALDGFICGAALAAAPDQSD